MTAFSASPFLFDSHSSRHMQWALACFSLWMGCGPDDELVRCGDRPAGHRMEQDNRIIISSSSDRQNKKRSPRGISFEAKQRRTKFLKPALHFTLLQKHTILRLQIFHASSLTSPRGREVCLDAGRLRPALTCTMKRPLAWLNPMMSPLHPFNSVPTEPQKNA